MNRGFIHRALARTVVVVGSLILPLAISEFALRLYGLGSPLLYEESLLFGYQLAPNQSETRMRSARVTIDEQGLRVARPWIGPRRILFFGDSVTYGGSYIDDGELFSELVCSELNDGNHSLQYTCANAGVNAYGVRNMLQRMEHDGIDDELAIVLTVYSGDFFRGVARLHSLPFFSRKPAEPLAATVELFCYGLDVVRSRLRFSSTLHGSRPGDLSIYERKEVAMLIRQIESVADSQERLGKKFLVVWSPSRQWIQGQRSIREKYVFDRLVNSRIRVLDMSQYLSIDLPVETVFYDDLHLERGGHRLYAQHIARTLGLRELETKPTGGSTAR